MERLVPPGYPVRHCPSCTCRSFPAQKAIDFMAKTTGPTQADILLNETALLTARSQQILRSLLGPLPNSTTARTEAELESEDAENFKPEPNELYDV